MNRNKELETAIWIAKAAGSILLQHYNTELNISVKDNNTFITNADNAANDFIIKELHENFPYPILSEESVDDRKRLGAEKVWVVDPLDGTNDFINKTGEFTVAIGLLQNNQPVIGVVYRPTTQELFYAQKGEGAFMDMEGHTKRLAVSQSNSVSEARFASSYTDEKYSNFMKRIGAENLVRVGSAALKICKIAQGEYDAFFVIKSRMSEWDDCAPGLILTEAGGTLSDIFGNPLLYNQKNISRNRGTLASNKNIYKELLQKISPIAREEYTA